MLTFFKYPCTTTSTCIWNACTETLRTSCSISLKEFVMPFCLFPHFKCHKINGILRNCITSLYPVWILSVHPPFPPSLYSLDFHILKKRWRCIITFAQQHSLESACHSLKCKMNITFFAQQQSLEAACMECKFMLQSIFFQIVFSSMN